MFALKPLSPPGFIRRLSRTARVWLGVILILCTIVLVPLTLAAVGYLTGFDTCEQRATEGGLWICTNEGRWIATIAAIAAGLPAVSIWTRFVQGVVSYQDPTHRPKSEHETSYAKPSWYTQKFCDLPFGQRLLLGTVTSCSTDSHSVQLGDEYLTFWSVHALRAGRIKKADQLSLVYQRIPGIPTLKVALAFRRQGSTHIHMIAPTAQAAAVLISTMCIFWFTWLSPHPRAAWAMLSGLILVEALTYLALLLRAKVALRGIASQDRLPPSDSVTL